MQKIKPSYWIGVLKKHDWFITLPVMLLTTLGLITIYSMDIKTTDSNTLWRQLFFVTLGLILYFVISVIDYSYWSVLGWIMLAIELILLVYLLVLGVPINNTRRWIIIGNFLFQPSEYAKIIAIITTAFVMSRDVNEAEKARYNWISLGISAAISFFMIFLIFKEPDAGTSLITAVIWSLTAVFAFKKPIEIWTGLFGATIVVATSLMIVRSLYQGNVLTTAAAALIGLLIWLSILLFSLRKRALLIIFLIFTALGIFANLAGWFGWSYVLDEYQKDRVLTYVNPEESTQGRGFQVEQAKIAIGSGGFLGKGLGHGTQSKLNFLPEHKTDFIFAAFVEELGLVGGIVLLSLYGVLILRILILGNRCTDQFGAIICVGVASKLLVEVFVNIGMNLGVTPTTGIPLPFVSAGGSNMLSYFLSIGLVQSVYKRRLAG